MSLPLAGQRVVVTRPAGQRETLMRGLRAAGAEAVWLELLAVGAPADGAPLREAAARIDRFDWVAFTSANAVAPLVDAVPGAWPGEVSVAAVGEATARALRAVGIEPRLVSARGTGGSLGEEMAALGSPTDQRVLLPIADDARPELRESLRNAGAEVTAVVAYEKRVAPGAAERVAVLFPAGEPLGWVTFTSPRLAATFAELVDRHAGGWEARRGTLRAASIGPTTSSELRRLGVDPTVEAAAPSDDELINAMRSFYSGS